MDYIQYISLIPYRKAFVMRYFIFCLFSVIIPCYSFISLSRNQYSVRFLRIISLCFCSFCMRFSCLFVHFHRDDFLRSSIFNLPSVTAFLYRVPSCPSQTTFPSVHLWFVRWFYFFYCIRSELVIYFVCSNRSLFIAFINSHRTLLYILWPRSKQK